MNSVLSFPDRGPWGDSNYRGNTSGYAIKATLTPFKRRYFSNPKRPGMFVDICEGGMTSRDLSATLVREGWSLEYNGLDLRTGYNMVCDKLTDRLPREASFLFCHPPYFNLVQYSGSQWGDSPHPFDLSHAPSYAEFLSMLKMGLDNAYEALMPGGRYCVQVGDIRRRGTYLSLQADLVQIAPGSIDQILIKTQHNCVSDSRTYANEDELVKIRHEYLLVFFKERVVMSWVAETLEKSARLQMLADATWRSVVEAALLHLGGRARLPEIYDYISDHAGAKTKNNRNWEARVRGTLRTFAVPEERGVWAHTQAARRHAA
jgi:DNA methylase